MWNILHVKIIISKSCKPISKLNDINSLPRHPYKYCYEIAYKTTQFFKCRTFYKATDTNSAKRAAMAVTHQYEIKDTTLLVFVGCLNKRIVLFGKPS